MLSIKAVLLHILTWISGHFDGASSPYINYGTQTTVTPSRSGWLVACSTVQSDQTYAPVLRIRIGTEIIAEGIGLTPSGSYTHCCCYVKKGVTYNIVAYRSSITYVRLY